MDPAAELQRLCADFDHREISRTAFLDRCMRITAAAIGCSRAGTWVFEGWREGPQNTVRDADREGERVGNRDHDTARNALRLHCIALYDAVNDRTTRAPDVQGPAVSDYYLALERAGHVVATDVTAHFATAGLFEQKLQRNVVRSLLATAFSINGRLYGAFTCTQLGAEVEWSRQQLNALRAVGSRVSLALANSARDPADGHPAPLPPH